MPTLYSVSDVVSTFTFICFEPLAYVCNQTSFWLNFVFVRYTCLASHGSETYNPLLLLHHAGLPLKDVRVAPSASHSCACIASPASRIHNDGSTVQVNRLSNSLSTAMTFAASISSAGLPSTITPPPPFPGTVTSTPAALPLDPACHSEDEPM